MHTQILDGQLTWFVYMIGAIVKGRLTTGTTDGQELVDGDLSARVLSLLKSADSQPQQVRNTVLTVPADRSGRPSGFAPTRSMILDAPRRHATARRVGSGWTSRCCTFSSTFARSTLARS